MCVFSYVPVRLKKIKSQGGALQVSDAPLTSIDQPPLPNRDKTIRKKYLL